MMIFALCTVMFVLSCRKHATKIVTLMEAQKDDYFKCEYK